MPAAYGRWDWEATGLTFARRRLAIWRAVSWGGGTWQVRRHKRPLRTTGARRRRSHRRALCRALRLSHRLMHGGSGGDEALHWRVLRDGLKVLRATPRPRRFPASLIASYALDDAGKADIVRKRAQRLCLATMRESGKYHQ